MKKFRTVLSLLLAAVMIICVCGAFVTANAVPDDGETVYYQIAFVLPGSGILARVRTEAGTIPAYGGRTTAQDDYFDYALTGWTPELVPAESDATYTALFTRTLRTDEGAKSRLRGDANGDGAIDILDATTIQRYLAGLYDDPHRIINVLGITANENEITILNATRIQRYLAGFSNVWHIGEVIDPNAEPIVPTEPPTDAPTDVPTDPPVQPPTSKDPYELPPV